VPERDHDPNQVCDDPMDDKLFRPIQCKYSFSSFLGEAINLKPHQICVLDHENAFPIVTPKSGQFVRYHFRHGLCRNDEELLEAYNSSEMLFRGSSLVYLPHSIKLFNKHGLPLSHEGSDHMNIRLDFHSEYVIPAGVHSVYNIVQSFYRIKGNKFENFYEELNMILEPCEEENKEEMKCYLKAVAEKIYLEENMWIVCPVVSHQFRRIHVPFTWLPINERLVNA
jgi:hypothetical protein